MESYALTFEEEGALDKFEKFASVNGPKFYGLPLNEDTLTLTKKDHRVPERITLSETILFRFMRVRRWHGVLGQTNTPPDERLKTLKISGYLLKAKDRFSYAVSIGRHNTLVNS